MDSKQCNHCRKRTESSKHICYHLRYVCRELFFLNSDCYYNASDIGRPGPMTPTWSGNLNFKLTWVVSCRQCPTLVRASLQCKAARCGYIKYVHCKQNASNCCPVCLISLISFKRLRDSKLKHKFRRLRSAICTHTRHRTSNQHTLAAGIHLGMKSQAIPFVFQQRAPPPQHFFEPFPCGHQHCTRSSTDVLCFADPVRRYDMHVIAAPSPKNNKG